MLTTDPPVMLGVDVSRWQRVDGCDWMAGYGHGCRFAIVQLTKGEVLYQRGVEHLQNARLAGLHVGGYHYANPRGDGMCRAKEQADFFCAALDQAAWPLEGGIIPFLDIEWEHFGKFAAGKKLGRAFRKQFSAKVAAEWATTFCERVEENLGVVPGIYTGPSYIKYRLQGGPDLTKYPLWLADYAPVGRDRRGIPSPLNWPEPPTLNGEPWPVVLWQFTGKGSVPWYRGGRGKIDRDLFRGSSEDFAELLVPGVFG